MVMNINDMFGANRIIDEIVESLVKLHNNYGFIQPNDAAKILKIITDNFSEWLEKNYSKEEIKMFEAVIDMTKFKR